MITESAAIAKPTITLPDISAVALNAVHAAILSADGELNSVNHDQARLILHKKPAFVCHAPYVRSRLKLDELYGFDVLELFAFVHPATFATPTIKGLCSTLGLHAPETFEDEAMSLLDIAKALLQDIQNEARSDKNDPLKIAQVMGLNGKGWAWTPFIFSALGQTYDEAEQIVAKTSLNVWKHLPEWAEESPESPPAHHPVSGEESRERLKKLLGSGAEQRSTQMEYTTHLTAAFQPVKEEGQPHVVLAEAGTGTGKTLGYLAPSSVWAEKNQGTVWISTYTKNLQRQIDQELDKLYPNTGLKDTHVAVRKGRENYLCLLNLEETVAGAALARHPNQAIAAGIMARWAASTKDGDLTGLDFPGWLSGLLGFENTTGLADRRGECIFSACDHYHKCFVERSIRKAKRARIVVANHALVMINAALSAPGEDMPARYVFDEGHHLFDAADSAYAAHLTAQETRDLRRWILGPEGGRRSRARGLKKRAEDLCEGDDKADKALNDIILAAGILTADRWTHRLKDGSPLGVCEYFLQEVYRQVYARADGRDGPYSLETQSHPVNEKLLEQAEKLKTALKKLQKPMQELSAIFSRKLADDEGTLASDTRKRLDAVAASLDRHSVMIGAWINMLKTLEKADAPQEFVDWMEIERIDGRAIDVGLYRHHVDPMKPFAASIVPHLHGMVVTSATLRDHDDGEDSWNSARLRTAAHYLTPDPHEISYSSPFDFAAQTKIFIINDVNKNDLGQVAGAYRTLFESSNGGALGLFTAVQRLRTVHDKIAATLEKKGLSLYAQHVDEIDPGTLVDIFRDDLHACLLGTDAIRDGVDVPGESLRLIVFDRVPWPRPNILHKARREAFTDMLGGKRHYDEMITRLKLKQAFGRLIRRSTDKGVFVMLDPMLPSRLQNAFPAEVEIQKIGLSEAASSIRNFLHK